MKQALILEKVGNVTRIMLTDMTDDLANMDLRCGGIEEIIESEDDRVALDAMLNLRPETAVLPLFLVEEVGVLSFMNAA